MENSKVVICLILLILFRIYNYTVDGQCFRKTNTSSGGLSISINTTFCCRNFEPTGKNKACKECENGFTSNGSKCEPCSNGKYGTKCGKTCACQTNQWCEHVNGCISNKNRNTENIITVITTVHTSLTGGTGGILNNQVIIFMVAIAVIGVIVSIIWSMWRFRCQFFRKKSMRNILNLRRIRISDGLKKETKFGLTENDRKTTYDFINENDMLQ